MESEVIATAVKKPKGAGKKPRPPRENVDPQSDEENEENGGESNPQTSDSEPTGDRKRRDSEPMMEEDFIEGFAIATFVNRDDLEEHCRQIEAVRLAKMKPLPSTNSVATLTGSSRPVSPLLPLSSGLDAFDFPSSPPTPSLHSNNRSPIRPYPLHSSHLSPKSLEKSKHKKPKKLDHHKLIGSNDMLNNDYNFSNHDHHKDTPLHPAHRGMDIKCDKNNRFSNNRLPGETGFPDIKRERDLLHPYDGKYDHHSSMDILPKLESQVHRLEAKYNHDHRKRDHAHLQHPMDGLPIKSHSVITSQSYAGDNHAKHHHPGQVCIFSKLVRIAQIRCTLA